MRSSVEKTRQPDRPPPLPLRCCGPRRKQPDETWHTEAQVQSAVLRELVADGWEILSVADTESRQHGVDVVARRELDELAIEVKGFPSRDYADPRRAGERKPTQPSTQAKHWYAQAILAAMLTRTRRPRSRSVIALPDFPRYRNLVAETAGSLRASEIEVWFVLPGGSVVRDAACPSEANPGSPAS